MGGEGATWKGGGERGVLGEEGWAVDFWEISFFLIINYF